MVHDEGHCSLGVRSPAETSSHRALAQQRQVAGWRPLSAAAATDSRRSGRLRAPGSHLRPAVSLHRGQYHSGSCAGAARGADLHRGCMLGAKPHDTGQGSAGVGWVIHNEQKGTMMALDASNAWQSWKFLGIFSCLVRHYADTFPWAPPRLPASKQQHHWRLHLVRTAQSTICTLPGRWTYRLGSLAHWSPCSGSQTTASGWGRWGSPGR